MALTLRSVTRSKGTIHFGPKVDDRALKGAMEAIEEAQSRGFTPLVLDFRRTVSAYAHSVLPLICFVEGRRARGQVFRVVLPDDASLARLFVNTGWAHLLDPTQRGQLARHPAHLPVRRYTTPGEQQDAVRDATDVVLSNMQLRRDVIRALEWTVNEITDNVLNHAKSPAGGLVQVDTFAGQKRIQLVVSDGGRGIPAAMRETFPRLHDFGALTEAMKPGVTSPRDAGQGNGLAGSARIAEYAKGKLKILSGSAALYVYPDERGEYKTQRGSAPQRIKFPGTTVMVELSTDADFAIEEALALDGRKAPILDVVDLRYSAGDDALVLRICDETVGVGTRQAGAELRRKCLNLLAAEPGKRLIVDWAGVPLVSSSFADEAIGKLFVEMGFSSFTARVGHANTEPLVASLLDRAVMQRVTQEMSRGDEA